MRRLLVLVCLFVGCGGAEAPDPCLDAPTYTNQIVPIVQDHCLACHDEGLQGVARNGAPMNVNFNDYASIEPNISRFADNITSGRMPPPEAENVPPINSDQRRTVDAWRRCGYPQ